MTPDIHTLAGAYVLDAVEPDERVAFEQHLGECVSCRDEVAALRQAAASLGSSVAEAPPAHLKQRVLAAAEQTPQLPPLTRPGPARRSRWSSALIAAAAVVAIGLGGVAVQRAGDESPNAAAVFAAADARVQTFTVDGGGLRVAVSRDLGLVALDAADLPALPTGKVYQLWLVDDGRATSLGIMKTTGDVEDLPASGLLAVTAEPAGGSDQPTSAPLVSLDPQDV